MAHTITTMHEAFLHELGDTYDAEQQLTKALPALLKQAQHPRVKQGIEQHLRETEQQIKNLEQVFQSLGTKPEKVTCKGIAGIVAENTATLSEIKEKALIDGAIVGGSGKVEHYEIASYRCLVMKAQLMGHTQAAQLLEQNLQQEERMAQQLEQLDRQLGQELIAQGSALIGHDIAGQSSQAGMTGGMSSPH